MRLVQMMVMAVLLPLAGQGQDGVRFGNQEVHPPANIRSLTRCGSKGLAQFGLPVEGYYYLLLQLEALPGAKTRDLLQDGGITLLDYMRGNTYFARISQGAKLSCLRKCGARSLFAPQWQWKVEQILLCDTVPSFARRGDLLGVVVHYFEGVSEGYVLAEAKTLGISLAPNAISPIFRSFETWITRETLEELAAMPWVQYVGVVSPPQELFRLDSPVEDRLQQRLRLQ